ncbi:MAG TPA: aminoglycoside phosphotransferase family protein [Kofleriaceae bacterium]|nr:aminoglycoside phosphotransferase family protein [Kofleriaceae bacterium]
MTAAPLLGDPLLSDATDVRALSGLSGAQVVLMTRDGRRWFVRKAARDPAGSARLRRQLDKQLAFGHALGGAIRAPEVLGHGELDGRFYFDMEYVRGMDGVSYLRRASYHEVGVVADRLCGYLDEVSTRAPCAATGASLFDALYTKLCDVHRRTALEAAEGGGELGGDTLAQLFLGLEQLRHASAGLAPTMCHGDLTLENLVVDEHGALWLLDFLDAPFEHWWQDVAKLHQDLDGGWYQLSQPAIARCVLDYLSRRLLAAAARREPMYARVHAVLLACTFVRILPYARTPEERRFVRARVEHFARMSCAPGGPG